MADGLTHGMYLLLEQILVNTRFWERVRPAGDVPRKLRARKSTLELLRIRQAIQTTERIWEATRRFIRPGVTEIDISEFMHAQLEERGIHASWDWRYCPTVSVGPDSPIGHVGPSEIEVRPGNLVQIDFGVNEGEYCSDMQRTFYVLATGDTGPPEVVQRHFAIVDRCIQEAASFIRPGLMGWEVDNIARQIFEEKRLEPWRFALGHQMGRATHDGGTVIVPRWERYGNRPYGIIEKDEVYTLEIGCPVDGYGFLSLEEDIVVNDDGCEFLTSPQRDLILIHP